MSETANTEQQPAPVDHSEVFKRAREYVQAKVEIARLTELIDAQKKIKDGAESYLLDAFANEPGLGGIKVDGHTVYLKRTLYANAPDKDAGYQALVAAGFEEFAQHTFNANSVSALFREWDKSGQEPPAVLAAVFTVAERYQIGATRS